MASKNTFIFLPNEINTTKNGYLKGFYKKVNNCDTYYVTDNKIFGEKCSECIGTVGKFRLHEQENLTKFIHIDQNQRKIETHNSRNSNREEIVLISYDLLTFRNSNVINSNCQSYGEHFQNLSNYLKTSASRKIKESFFINSLINFVNILQLTLFTFEKLLKYSEMYVHFQESLNNLKWFLISIKKGEKSPKFGNAILAKFLDIALGAVLINYLMSYKYFIINYTEEAIEGIIRNLSALLLYLMGSPIGLKLNYAFNNCLGTFFFYHISLWRIFLKGLQPLFVEYFNFLIIPCYFGLTFQIAMISDIISIGTFHVYCIYVYAARIFNLQIKGIISLWRLFIGRKFNPLRNRIDSCDYSQNQLFIGTLGFTVLLFLLPTTTMYYTVFTTFRLIISSINYILNLSRFYFNRLPFFVLILWFLDSSSVAGTLYLQWKHNASTNFIVLEAKLYALPLFESISKFMPYNEVEKGRKSISAALRNIVEGVIF